MKINSPESYRAFQIDIAHEWRAKHNLPPLPDQEAIERHFGADAVPAPPNRRRMNTREHIQRLLKVWDLCKPKLQK